MLRFVLFCCSLLFSATLLSQSRAKSARFKLCSSDGEILAYSDSYNPLIWNQAVPEFLQEFIQLYKKQGKRYADRQKGSYVAPLLKSTRTQLEPYNGSAPYYKYENGMKSENRCVSGCVATALEQVISYYRYPPVLKDTLHGWTTENYEIVDVLPGTPIDWDNILTNYAGIDYTESQAKAIADLTFYIGMAAHMNWGTESSGASLFNAINSLYEAFDYKTLYLLSRGRFSNPAWNRLLRNELSCGRPIVYTGHTYHLSGHCFVIDGVDEEGYYHVNWGEEDNTLYLDLDYLNPFEPLDDLTIMGKFHGMFNNHTALFMHPDDFEIDIHDSLTTENAYHGVKLENVTFSRQPDTNDYVQADFDLVNLTQDSLNFTFEVFTYMPTDTAVFEHANYVGLTTVDLLPGEHKVWPVICRFSQEGEYIFACSADDETLLFAQPINIQKGVKPIFVYGPVSHQLLRLTTPEGEEDLTARITFDLSNAAESGGIISSFTYCLFEEASSVDVRHFNFIQLLGGETYTENVYFHHLKDGQRYRYITRRPWAIQKEYEFVVNSSEAIDALAPLEFEGNQSHESIVYDLTGRQIRNPRCGIFIKDGKKILINKY